MTRVTVITGAASPKDSVHDDDHDDEDIHLGDFDFDDDNSDQGDCY